MKLKIFVDRFYFQSVCSLSFFMLFFFACEREQQIPETVLESKNVEQLIELLKSERNVETGDGIIPRRVQVARELGQRKDKKAIMPLVELLSSKDESVLSSGASGVTAGAHATYSTAVNALSLFGAEAKSAIPRIRSLLKANDPSLPLPDSLVALYRISPQDALEVLLERLQTEGPDLVSLVVALEKLHPEVCEHSGVILQSYKQTASSFSQPVKSRLVNFTLACRAKEIVDYLPLLEDDEVLRRINVRAVEGNEELLLPWIKKRLESVEARAALSFSTAATCGPRTPEGGKDMIRGTLFSLLIQLCTKESIEVLETHRRQFSITVKCEQSDRSCRKRLSMPK